MNHICHLYLTTFKNLKVVGIGTQDLPCHVGMVLGWCINWLNINTAPVLQGCRSHMLRFHENSSLFLGENCFLVFHLAFISHEKIIECTAMHLATWKPDFTGGCKQRVNCYQIARHVSPDTIQTSPNTCFLGGFIFDKYLSITFLDVVVQTRYLYSTCKYLSIESLITKQNIAKYNVI